jgi:hypothetical protein
MSSRCARSGRNCTSTPCGRYYESNRPVLPRRVPRVVCGCHDDARVNAARSESKRSTTTPRCSIRSRFSSHSYSRQTLKSHHSGRALVATFAPSSPAPATTPWPQPTAASSETSIKTRCGCGPDAQGLSEGPSPSAGHPSVIGSLATGVKGEGENEVLTLLSVINSNSVVFINYL